MIFQVAIATIGHAIHGLDIYYTLFRLPHHMIRRRKPRRRYDFCPAPPASPHIAMHAIRQAKEAPPASGRIPHAIVITYAAGNLRNTLLNLLMRIKLDFLRAASLMPAFLSESFEISSSSRCSVITGHFRCDIVPRVKPRVITSGRHDARPAYSSGHFHYTAISRLVFSRNSYYAAIIFAFPHSLKVMSRRREYRFATYHRRFLAPL